MSGGTVVLPDVVAAEIKYAFDEYSRPGADGAPRLSKAQLSSLLRALGQAPTDQEVEDLLKLGDVDGDKSLDKSETLQLLTLQYAAGMAAGTKDEQQDFEAFSAFDSAGRGYVSVEDVAEVLKKVGPDVYTAELAEAMVAAAAADGSNSVVTFPDFVRITKSAK